VLETIKSYLVSLGFKVDTGSYNEATKTMDNAEKSVAKFAGSATAKFAATGVAVATFAVTSTIAIAKFVGGLAQADLANEKLARQMWTSKDAAMSYNNTLKAMGVTLQDLYLSPELMRNFQALRQQANDMRAPDEYGSMMKEIRSIQYEFVRMKLEATYALQWIGYYFIKYMSGPIHDIKKTLSDINGTIIKTMPSWTKVIAQVMSWFARMGITTVRAIKDIIRVFDEIGRNIPKNIKLIGAAISALGLIISTGPIGMLTALFVTLILLLDDFYTYLDGGESQFGPFWAKLIAFFDKLNEAGGFIENLKNGFKDAFQEISKWIDIGIKGISDFYHDLEKNGAIDNFKKAFSNTFDSIKIILGEGKKWIQDLFSELDKQGVLTDLKKSFEDVILSASNLLKAVTDIIDKLLGLDGTQKSLDGIGNVLNNVIIVALKTINGLLESISGLTNIISSSLDGSIPLKIKQSGESATQRLAAQPNEDNQGFWGGLWQTTKEIFTNSPNIGDKVRRLSGRIIGSQDYLYPQSNTQNNNNSKTTLNQTNNIYGSDPSLTADQVKSKTESILMRNMQGVMQR
jgi:hypothetical protein